MDVPTRTSGRLVLTMDHSAVNESAVILWLSAVMMCRR